MIKPRPHQVDAVKSIVATLNNTNCAQAHMACGSGKTYIAHHVQQKIKSDITVMFVPTIMLAHQACRDFIDYGSMKSTIVVCSSKPTKMESDEILDLKRLEIDVALSQHEIEEAIGSKTNFNVFCTYRSAFKLLAALRKKKLAVDFCVFDESHHVTSETSTTSERLVRMLRSMKTKKTLSLTATPKLHDKINLGPVAHKLSFSKAVSSGILCPYSILLSVFRQKHGDWRDEELASLAATKKAFELNVKRGLTFHNRVADAQMFVTKLQRVLRKNKIKVHHLNGTNSMSERSAVVDSVRNEGGIITNVRVLGEGFNFPELDFMVVVDPKTSVVDITQNVGRIMRKCEGKFEAMVIIPIVVDDNGVPVKGTKTAFKNTVLALAEHDDVIALALNNFRKGKSDGSDIERVLRVTGDYANFDIENIKYELIQAFSPRRDLGDIVDRLHAYIKENGYAPFKHEGCDDEHRRFCEDLSTRTCTEKYHGVTTIRGLVTEYNAVNYDTIAKKHGLRKMNNQYNRDPIQDKISAFKTIGIDPIVSKGTFYLRKTDVDTLLSHVERFKKKYVPGPRHNDTRYTQKYIEMFRLHYPSVCEPTKDPFVTSKHNYFTREQINKIHKSIRSTNKFHLMKPKFGKSLKVIMTDL